MSPGPETARVMALCADLTRDWDMVGRHLDYARSVDPGLGRPEAALVALSLDHAYQAFETLLVRLERALGLPDRVGAEWHRAVLADAAWPIPSVRAAVITRDGERDWDELRRFRHFLRHAYTVELDPGRLRANVDALVRACAGTGPLVRALIEALAVAP